MQNYSITATATVNLTVNEEPQTICVNMEITYDLYNTEEELREAAAELLLEQWTEEHATAIDIDNDEIIFEIDDWGDIPAKYQAIDSDLFEYLEFCENSHLDADVIEAAVYCDIDLDNIEEAYNGSFEDDEDFAQETAEQLGCIDKDAKWPMDCIDWEHAAKELMYDYSEHNGHYFRNF